VRLAEQWSDIQGSLPQGWRSVALSLELNDPAEADRAALVLGPAAPVRDGARFRLEAVREAAGVGVGAELLRRVLRRLDEDGVAGRLEVQTMDAEERADVRADGGSLAGQWRTLVEALPADWSHALASVELGSSDYRDRAALLLSPANPSAGDNPRSLVFRAARQVGYGVSVGMAARGLERLDAEGIGGRVAILHVVSDARPVATQGGPVWRLGGRVA
jgi:hypothetical protein